MGDLTDTIPSSAAPPLERRETQPPAVSPLHAAPSPAAPSPAAPSPATPSPPSETVESHFWLTRSDQVIFGLLSLVAFALLAVYWVRLSNWGTRTVEIERLPARQYEFHLDANSATWVEWGQINGIGDGLARRIVADREQNGPFRSVDDLGRVKGIGPKTLEHLRPWVRVAEESPPSEPARRKRAKPRAKRTTKNSKAEEPAG